MMIGEIDMSYKVFYEDTEGKLTECKEFGKLLDVDDLRCPKCKCEDFDWDKCDFRDPDSEDWDCICSECGNRFTVTVLEFYKIKRSCENKRK